MNRQTPANPATTPPGFMAGGRGTDPERQPGETQSPGGAPDPPARGLALGNGRIYPTPSPLSIHRLHQRLLIAIATRDGNGPAWRCERTAFRNEEAHGERGEDE